MGKVFVTKEEEKAIKSLKRLAKKWPESLTVFGWSGNMHILKRDDEGMDASICSIYEIHCDGGDPDHRTVNQYADIEYETESPTNEHTR